MQKRTLLGILLLSLMGSQVAISMTTLDAITGASHKPKKKKKAKKDTSPSSPRDPDKRTPSDTDAPRRPT